MSARLDSSPAPPAGSPRESRAPARIAVSTGEPAGIGPDICLALAASELASRVVVLGDREMLGARARQLGIRVKLHDYGSLPEAGSLECLHLPLGYSCRPGSLDARSAPYVLALLDRAVAGCMSGEFAALATAPVHKGVINDGGFAFTGHTEYLAERTGTAHVVMMLAGGDLRVALATTHLALADVPRALTRESLERTIRILDADLASRFGVIRPRILVAALNPHAGEGGYFGREEIEVIAPVLERLRAEGIHLVGPLPADTLFVPERLAEGDCVLAMYHDQGLPVLKYASFGRGVNVTLGLPIIRTSVDHGTATDIAGTGRAQARSLIEAVEVALGMARAGAPRAG